MKNIILIALASLVLFGVSAGLSVWLTMNAAKTADSGPGEKKEKKKASGDDHADPKDGKEGKEKEKEKANDHADPHKAEAKPPEAKPLNAKEAERAEYRRLQVDVVAADLSGQMQDYDTLLKRVNAEMKVLLKEQQDLEARAAEVRQIEDRTAKTAADMKKGQLEMDEAERANIAHIASLADQMAPEATAGLLQQLTDSGKTDTAVKVLAGMKERTAAKVLTAFTDPTVPPLLIERMQKLKRNPPPGGGP